MNQQGCILSCSPRAGGNSDQAAATLHAALSSHGVRPIVSARLAEIPITACVSCGFCLHRPGVCSLDSERKDVEYGWEGEPDQAMAVLEALCLSSPACLIAPIYFYHLPGKAKSLLDRCQAFHMVASEDKPGQGRALGVILLGARTKGDKLFAGSLLSLKYACIAIGLKMAEPLLLRGLDSPDAFLAHPEAVAAVEQYAAYLAGLRGK